MPEAAPVMTAYLLIVSLPSSARLLPRWRPQARSSRTVLLLPLDQLVHDTVPLCRVNEHLSLRLDHPRAPALQIGGRLGEVIHGERHEMHALAQRLERSADRAALAEGLGKFDEPPFVADGEHGASQAQMRLILRPFAGLHAQLGFVVLQAAVEVLYPNDDVVDPLRHLL